jgi:hypothetical protein
MAPQETSSDARRCVPSPPPPFRSHYSCLESWFAWIHTGSCLMTLLSFALAPLVVRLAGKVGVYLCLLLYYSFFQDLVLYLKLA